MYPEHFIDLIKNKIRKDWLFAFGSAFFTGLIIHLFRLTNHLLTWDSVYNFHDPQNIIHLGRCFLTLSCGIGSYSYGGGYYWSSTPEAGYSNNTYYLVFGSDDFYRDRGAGRDVGRSVRPVRRFAQ